MEVRALTDSDFAAEIIGLDISGRLSEARSAACRQALADRRVLVLRDQDPAPESYVNFARIFGVPEPHVLDHLRMDGTPEIMLVGNVGKTAKGERVHHGADYWHTDMSYESSPAIATMLYSVVAPVSGGETQFADMVGAFQALPETQQESLGTMRVRHRYGAASKGQVAAITDTQYATVPPVCHALVRTQPLNGNRSLYAITGTPECIEGMSEAQSSALLAQLRDHAIAERFIYRHPYRVGDIVVWDTTATLHSATTIPVASGPADSRLLWRVSVVSE